MMMMRKLDPPFPFPARWNQVQEMNGWMWGARWLMPGNERSFVLEQDDKNLIVQEQEKRDQDEREEGTSLRLDGEGSIVMTEEWASKLAAAAQRRSERLALKCSSPQSPYERFQHISYGPRAAKSFGLMEAALNAKMKQG